MADEWDASAIAAVVALVIALFALIVAAAQALQQYLITGQLIRLCDSVVFGPLPGQGRRIWQLSQFRFRVVYSIPQIGLQADLWPEQSPHIKSYAIGEDYLPNLDPVPVADNFSSSISAFSGSSVDGATIRRRHTSTTDSEVQAAEVDSESWSQSTRSQRFHTSWSFVDIWPIYWFSKIRSKIPFREKERRAIGPVDGSVGEASWVSFCKAINGSCGASVRYHSVTYDADRCPSDLVTAPMQVSMRDVAVMGLTAGMKITSCSFMEKSISMQGAVGSITSSNHAILGPILHFTPRAFTSVIPRSLAPESLDDRGIVEPRWLARTWNVCTVAGTFFNSLKRRTTRRLDDRWSSYQEVNHPPRVNTRKRAFHQGGIVPVDEKKKHRPTRGPPWTRMRMEKQNPKEKPNTPEPHSTLLIPQTRATISVTRRPQDGPWTITQPDSPSRLGVVKELGGKEKAPVVNVQSGTGEYEEVHVTPLTPPEPTIDPALSGGQAATSAGAVQEQHSGQKSATKEPPKSNEVYLIVGETPEHVPEVWPGQANDSTQEGTKASRQGDDTQPAPAPMSTFQGEPQAGASEFPMEATKREQVQNDSWGVSLEASESRSPAPQVAGGGSLATFGRPVTPLLLTQTSHWEELPAGNPQGSASQGTRKRQLRRQATVEDAPDSGEGEGASRAGRSPDPETHDRGLAAKMRQKARNERSRKIQRDKAVVEGSKTDDGKPQLLLTYPQGEPDSEPSRSTSKTEDEMAHEREAERRQRREERERERDRRNKSRGNVVSLDRMDMYWFCQVDIYQGFWATPWASVTPLQTSLTGAITVILEALLGFLEEKASLVYCQPSAFYLTQGWISHGGTSYPAYASNARGGVISQGAYTGVRVSAFKCAIPVLELLYSYDWQVSSYPHDQERYCEEQNIELMRIDAWLSYVGRTDEISRGPRDLLKGVPALVQLLQAEFEIDFMNIDLSAKEGGHQDIQGLADNVMDFLTDEELNEAEQLYILVALLRAVKVCQCVLAGSNTTEILDILLKDVQAHLV
ncbi:hypothetical protein NCS55_01194900 [Fusarium keratoplasticum]|nr:hypothetical protein NCS55_01194900 [Fusarium keratoplasticum]